MASRSAVCSRSDCSSYQTSSPGWDKDSKQNGGFSSGVTDLVSTRKWLQVHGLRRQKMDLFHLLPKIGFKLSDDYDFSLKKPVSSRYGNALFPQIYRPDGRTFNIVCCKEKLDQIIRRLARITAHLQERLHWLTSGSRRIFGVIEEKRICIVVASSTNDEQSFELLKKALQIIVEDQVSKLEAFNIILSAVDSDSFHKECVQITHDTVHKIIEWIQNLSLPLIHSATSVCGAVLIALQDEQLEAVYLLCEGSAVRSCQELLRNKVLQSGKSIPVHVNTFNCYDNEILAFLKRFVNEIGGRFHAYETYRSSEDNSPRETDGMALYPADALFSKRNAGKETSVASREDVVELFAELEDARNTFRQIQQVIDLAPMRKNEIAIESCEMLEDEEEEAQLNEDSMSSREWLSRYGIEVHGLEIYDLLKGVAFKHKTGCLDLLGPPRHSDIRTSAVCKSTAVNAKYCKNFPAIEWKSGQMVHVNMTPQVQRDYEERMMMVLNAVQQRLNWLKKGSRAVFGTLLEDQVYLVLDTSSSMEPKIPDALERIGCLLQEQLQHKNRFNIVTFNRAISAWKERLTEVTPKNILDALEWLRTQPCGGSTNTYAALRFALADPGTQGIYLITDGRPDQPCRSILAQVQMRPSVPIHTVAFNCYDEEANSFLYELANSTGGRYHYYTDNDYDIQPPESWKSEDLRLLEDELARGYKSLATVSRLREECIMSLWKREIARLKNSKCKPVTSSESWAPPPPKDIYRCQKSCSSTGKDSCPTSRVHQRQQHCLRQWQRPPPPQWPFIPSCCRMEQGGSRAKMSNRHLFAASTKTSRLRHKIALKRSMSSPSSREIENNEEEDEQQREELEREEGENCEETETNENSFCLRIPPNMAMDQGTVFMSEGNNINGERRGKQSSSYVKNWLKRKKLSAKRLTIMDALSPTLIPHKAKHVPILDKHVLSKVFDEVFPLAHVMRGKNMQMTLVNPKGVDLAAYEEKLQKAIKSYESFLEKTIWNALPGETREELGSEKPLPFYKNKGRLLAALRNNNWPVSAEDVALIEREIEKGFKYLQMSHDLQKSDLCLPESPEPETFY